MSKFLNEEERNFLLIHLIFAIICMMMLSSVITLLIGIKLFILVVLYNLIIPLFGLWRKYEDWIDMWLFSILLSMLQIWPDWFLSAQLGVLVFPEDGLFKIGTVSGYMLFLWAIPFFIILFVGERVNEHSSQHKTYIVVALISLLIFGSSELTIWMIGSWYAQNVIMIGHAALYIIIPEILLGLSLYCGYNFIKEKAQWHKIYIAPFIMILYLGNAVFFYFLIEKILVS